MAGPARLLSGFAGRLGSRLVVLASVVCAACSGSQLHVAPAATPATVPLPAALDASYDWHGLVRIPFQTLLKESPVPLHEVLLFHEEPRSADIENKDCYAGDATPPRFVGQQPETYLFCFDHDHLNRIEASVRLAAADGPTVLARACALWSKNSRTDPATVADAAVEEVQLPGNQCEGHDGGVAYSAHVALVPGDADGTLSITLLDVVPRT